MDSKVTIELTNKHEAILEDMGLIDETGSVVQGVRMQGVIQNKYRNSFDVYCGAAEEGLNVVCSNTVASNDENPPNYYVVVDDEAGKPIIKEVTGLILPKPVNGYHLEKQDAVVEQQRIVTARASTATNSTTG